MFILIIICLILIIFFLWWIETKFNLLYQAKTWLDTEFKRRREQTKLKIDIYKIIILVIIGSLITYVCYLLLGKLYLPYFENVLDLQREGISLKTLESGNAILISDWLTFSDFTNDALKSSEEDTSSQIGYWGTFGDFIGGTLNPILTFISICLILYTVYQNKKSLDFNSEELSLSRKAQENSASAQSMIQQTQSLQQFDSFFFSLLNQIKSYETDISKNTINQMYIEFFDSFQNINFDSISELNKKYELNSYFLVVFELVKNIYERVGQNSDLQNTENIAKNYINIIKVTMPFKLQQLLMLKVYESIEYRDYFIRYHFFDQTPFFILDEKSDRFSPLAISLILSYKNLRLEGEKIDGINAFGQSRYLKELNKTEWFRMLFEHKNFQEIIVNGNSIIKKLFMFKKYTVFFAEPINVKKLVIIPESMQISIVLEVIFEEVIDIKIFYQNIEIYIDFILIKYQKYLFKIELSNNPKVYQSYNYKAFKEMSEINIEH